MTPKEKDEELSRMAAATVADIKQQFQLPYFLRSEDPKLYDRILLDVVKAKPPRDFIQKMLARDIANSVWFDLRLDRHTGYAFERLEALNCSQQPLLLEHAANVTSTPSQDLEPAAADQAPKPRVGQFIAIAECQPDIAMIEPSREVRPAVKMQEEMSFVQKLDTLKGTNIYRRNVSLKLWTEYKAGSLPAAYLVRKEHQEQADAEIAERNASIDEMLATKRHEPAASPAPASTTTPSATNSPPTPVIASVSPDEPSNAPVVSTTAAPEPPTGSVRKVA